MTRLAPLRLRLKPISLKLAIALLEETGDLDLVSLVARHSRSTWLLRHLKIHRYRNLRKMSTGTTRVITEASLSMVMLNARHRPTNDMKYPDGRIPRKDYYDHSTLATL
jgi:hypothetical protein